MIEEVINKENSFSRPSIRHHCTKVKPLGREGQRGVARNSGHGQLTCLGSYANRVILKTFIALPLNQTLSYQHKAKTTINLHFLPEGPTLPRHG